MNRRPDVLDIFLNHMGLPVVGVETLDELNSDHNPVLLTVDILMTVRMLRGSGHFDRWDEFRRYLQPIELSSDPFLFTDALEIEIKAITNILTSEKIA